jgi:hypothetical protein
MTPKSQVFHAVFSRSKKLLGLGEESASVECGLLFRPSLTAVCFQFSQVARLSAVLCLLIKDARARGPFGLGSAHGLGCADGAAVKR